MNRILNIYYTLLDKLKDMYTGDTRNIIQLMQEDVLAHYLVINTNVDYIQINTRTDYLIFLINLAFYLGETNEMFMIHCNILKDISGLVNEMIM